MLQTILSAIACVLSAAAIGIVVFGQRVQDPADVQAQRALDERVKALRADLEAVRASAARDDMRAKLAAIEADLGKFAAKSERVEEATTRMVQLTTQVGSLDEQMRSVRQTVADATSGKFAGKSMEADGLMGAGNVGAYEIRFGKSSPLLRLTYANKKELGFLGAVEDGNAALFRVQSASNWKAIELFANNERAQVRTCTGATCTTLASGGDVAERLRLVPGETIHPGMAVSVSSQSDGQIEASRQAYDSRFVGIVAGAGGISPALVIGNEAERPEVPPISLVGVVFALADATDEPIRKGELLATSSVKGHLARAKPEAIPSGALVGKSLDNLDSGRGLIRVILGAR